MLKGDFKMKWEFEEDFIVCKFYLSHVDSWKEHIGEVLAELYTEGFTRDKNKVQMRISNYEYLHIGHGLCHPAKQSRRILDGILKAQLTSAQLQSYLNHNYSLNVNGSAIDLTTPADEKSDFIYTEPLDRSFQEVLFDFIKQSGMKDPEVYKASQIGRDTFSLICSGKRSASKRTVRQLCFGLKLSYEEAVMLMESAGYAFSKNNLTDMIVSYYLKNKEYDIFEANATLYENKAELLFS